MKTTLKHQLRLLCLIAGVAGVPAHAHSQDLLVKPSRGGGLDTNAPMIHVDVFYDYAANQMHATLDTSHGVAKLVPLPGGYSFDSRSNYAVLSGKAYNFQYAWNPGGVFAPPDGAAVWIECLSASPELETYDGPGNKMISPPRTYDPIFGTDGSPRRWQWYGAMAHNSYAVRNPSTNEVAATYRVYFGDAVTGAPEAYAGYDDATVTLTWTVDPVILVRPARGGGLDTNAPMIHVDVFYDYAANEMHATLDTSYGIPKMNPLPLGYGFDSRSNYYVLTGKAYSLQYAWNPGGIFSPPAGATVWIECLSAPPGLETYDGPGNKNENPPRPYTPILGTAGSSPIWQWYGRMAHNACAILNPTTNILTAEYRVYFGDAITGAREAYSGYDDATVRLTWTVDPVPAPLLFQFGALDRTNGAPLCFLNAHEFAAQSEWVVNLHCTNAAPGPTQYERCIPMLAVPATEANGGPANHHAALGSRVECQIMSLAGPSGARLSFWEAGEAEPRFAVPVGEMAGTNRICISVNEGTPGGDPYGNIQGRRFAVTQPGTYCLDFQLVDTCSNGPGGDPIHAPSERYRVYLQAGLTVNALSRQGASVAVSFGGESGQNFYLERATALGPSARWEAAAGPVLGRNRLQTLVDGAPTGGQNFYRLRGSVP